MVSRPEQKPLAERLYEEFGYALRAQTVTRALNDVRYKAAYFDGTPTTEALAQLQDAIVKAEGLLEKLEERLHDVWVGLMDLQIDVNKLEAVVANETNGGFAVLSGDRDEEELLDRLAALYGLDPHRGGWQSQNGLREGRRE